MILEFEAPIKELEKKIEELKKLQVTDKIEFSNEIAELEKKCELLKEEVYKNLTSWQVVQLARHPERPIFPDYLSEIFTDFVELHGDRYFADDRAIKCGFAKIDDIKAIVIGHQKGRNVKENLERNFAMSKPEGYRKALRLMKLAEKFDLPVITFIDTPGAYPGIDAEERGQAEAIAKNLIEMAGLEIPIISVVIGEGGSGGALAIGLTDKILMLSNAIYSVISPEGCASILWRDAAKASIAAEAMKVTARSLFELGVADEIIEEPLGGAHKNYSLTMKRTKEAILNNLKPLLRLSKQKLVTKRYEKYAKIGFFQE